MGNIAIAADGFYSLLTAITAREIIAAVADGNDQTSVLVIAPSARYIAQLLIGQLARLAELLEIRLGAFLVKRIIILPRHSQKLLGGICPSCLFQKLFVFHNTASLNILGIVTKLQTSFVHFMRAIAAINAELRSFDQTPVHFIAK